MLERALQAVSTSFAGEDSLRQARADRAEAHARFDEARAAVKRVENVIAEARAADRAARKADDAAKAAAREWAGQGCEPGLRHLVDEAEAKAAEANRAADAAERVAVEARAGLGTVEERAQSAIDAVDRCDEKIRGAIVRILMSELEPSLKALEAAAAHFNEAHVKVRGLYRLLDPTRIGWRDYDRWRADSAAKQIRDVLERSRIRDLSDAYCERGIPRGKDTPRDLLECTEAWRARAEQLLKEPT
jgi:hypothetical protein